MIPPAVPLGFEMPLPARIWSSNDQNKLHYMAKAELIRNWKIATRYHYQLNFGKQRQHPSIIRIGIPVVDNRRRDPHNYCGTVLKAVIDGLVMAGAWPDDTPDFVGHREPVLHHDEKVWIGWDPM